MDHEKPLQSMKEKIMKTLKIVNSNTVIIRIELINYVRTKNYKNFDNWNRRKDMSNHFELFCTCHILRTLCEVIGFGH